MEPKLEVPKNTEWHEQISHKSVEFACISCQYYSLDLQTPRNQDI